MNFRFEFVADEFAEVVGELVAVDLLDDFFEEAEYHEFHGVAFGDAALHHVEEFFGIDIPRRGTVRALHIVG